MANRTLDHAKLGIFILAGLILLVLFFYMLGRNQSIFSRRFEVKAHFENVGGLISGNNVRVSGIVVGIVEAVELVNDTLVEVTLALDNEMRNVVRKNALASIGTDGLIGNRVVNLLPAKERAPLIEPGDILQSKKDVDTDSMLRMLDNTNKNVLQISEGLLQTIERINKSKQLAALLENESMSNNLNAALINLRNASGTASATMRDLQIVVGDLRDGKGSVGTLLRDTSLNHELNVTVRKLQNVEDQADKLVKDMDNLVRELQSDIGRGQGPVNLMLKDSLASARLQNTLGNLEAGTVRFSENMEALKHNFLFRRYFRKLEKEKSKAAGKQ